MMPKSRRLSVKMFIHVFSRIARAWGGSDLALPRAGGDNAERTIAPQAEVIRCNKWPTYDGVLRQYFLPLSYVLGRDQAPENKTDNHA